MVRPTSPSGEVQGPATVLDLPCLDFLDLEQQCYSLLTHGVAPLIRHSYVSAQAKFIPSADSLANCTHQGFHAQWTNGRFV